MDPSIRRVQPEAALQAGAVRPVKPRRERGAKDEQRFADELAKEPEPDHGTNADEERPRKNTPVQARADELVGSRLDVTA